MKAKQHSTNKKKRNPSQFFKELEPLVGKEVNVRIVSDNGILSLVGELKLSSRGIFYVDNDENVGGLTKQSYEGRIFFEVDKILKINKNVIDLQSSPIIEKGILEEDAKLRLSEIINKSTFIYINQKFYGSGKVFFPTVTGKLKFNSKENLYYIQNYKKTIFCAFKPSAVRFTVKNRYLNEFRLKYKNGKK